MPCIYCEAQPMLCVLHIINNYCSCLSVVQTFLHAYYIIGNLIVHVHNIIIQTGAYVHHRYIHTCVCMCATCSFHLVFFRLLMCMRVQYSYPNLLIALFVCNAMYNAYTQVVYVCLLVVA